MIPVTFNARVLDRLAAVRLGESREEGGMVRGDRLDVEIVSALARPAVEALLAAPECDERAKQHGWDGSRSAR